MNYSELIRSEVPEFKSRIVEPDSLGLTYERYCHAFRIPLSKIPRSEFFRLLNLGSVSE